MAETIKTWWLTNGVTVEIIDETTGASRNSWTVKLVVKATIEVKTKYLDDFEENPDYLEILRMILPTAEYRRDIVKEGVKADQVDAEKTFLLEAFARDALFYFAREDFPERYVRNLYKELERKISAKRAVEKKDSGEFL